MYGQVSTSSPYQEDYRIQLQQQQSHFQTAVGPSGSSSVIETLEADEVRSRDETTQPSNLVHRRPHNTASNDNRSNGLTNNNKYYLSNPSVDSYTSNSANVGSAVYHDNPSPSSSNYLAPSSIFPLTKPQQGSRIAMNIAKYQHNMTMYCFLLPIVVVLLISHAHFTMIPLNIFIITLLILYGLDLSNQRGALVVTLWIGVVVNSMVSGWCWLLDEEADDDDGGLIVLEIIFKVAVQSIVYSASAFWLMLQFKTKSSNGINSNDSPSKEQYIPYDDESNTMLMSASDMESLLHSVVPPLFAAVSTQHCCNYFALVINMNASAAIAPYIFATMLTTAMLFVGSCRRSFIDTSVPHSDCSNKSFTIGTDGGKTDPSKNVSSASFRDYSIRDRACVVGHTILLLIGPCMIFLSINLGRIIWSVDEISTVDVWYDLLLSVTVPLLLFHIIVFIHDSTHSWKHPYAIINTRNKAGCGSLLARIINPELTGQSSLSVPVASIIMLTAIAVQQRYVLPLCRALAYMMGNSNVSSWILTLYWFAGTATLLATFWLWGRRSSAVVVVSTATTENSQQQTPFLFGDNQEDIVQVGLAMSGMLLGKAFGMHWNMTPLPILGVLGLALWISTRMLRYLAIFLFVWHATAVVIFTYRFVGIDRIILLSTIPSPYELSLVHFALVLTATSILMGIVTGLAVRSYGGLGSAFVRKVDLTGQLFVLYTVMLTILEITLLKTTMSMKDLAGVDNEDFDVDHTMLYNPTLVYITSIVAIVVSIYLTRIGIQKKATSSVVVSLAIGKSIAVLIDSERNNDSGEEGSTNGSYVFSQALLTAFLCLVVYAPRLFLKPVHVKTSTRYKRDISGSPTLQHRTVRTIMLYVFVILPATLIGTVSSVLFPLVSIIASGNTYHTIKVPTSEFIGVVIALWGISCVSMLNYYLPDGGAEIWKKLSAFAFLLGTAIFVAATALGMSVTDVATNPYDSLSSVGSLHVQRSKSRTGGWGILLALVAVLLSVTGPLELKERRGVSGRTDKHVLFRTMMFSLLFGGGVAWFITVQFMSDTQWMYLALVMAATITSSFVGTCASVFGYYLELQNFEEVEALAHTWFILFSVLLFVATLSQLVGLISSHPFGVGGWISCYMTISSLFALIFTISVSKRKEKDSSTRGISNLACVISWLLGIIVCFGTFGVAGLVDEFDVQSIFGIPNSIIGTFALAPVLLLLEGESFLGGRRASVTTSQKRRNSSLRLNLPQLNSFNNWFPPIFGTLIILLVVSLYTVLLRGIIGGSGITMSNEGAIIASKTSADQGLAILAQKASSYNVVLTASKRLAGSGFWTANNPLGPIIHLTGIVSCVPTLFLLVRKWWLDSTIPSSQISLCMPLNAIPLLVCWRIPSLKIAALVNLFAAIHQYRTQIRDERIARMEM